MVLDVTVWKFTRSPLLDMILDTSVVEALKHLNLETFIRCYRYCYANLLVRRTGILGLRQ